eukprot:2117643-Alexandrium_andersonii.AAC.1
MWSRRAGHSALGTSPSIVSPLMSKERSDGAAQFRVTWDLRRARVDPLVRQGERIAPAQLLHGCL